MRHEQIIIRNPSDSRPTLSRSEQLAGVHDVPIGDLFSPSFMVENTDYDSIDAMLGASGLPLIDASLPAKQQSSLRASWDQLILLTTRYRSWDEMRTAGAIDWVHRRLLEDPNTVGNAAPAEKPPPENEISTEHRSQDLSRVPLERIRNLVEAGIAKRFVRNGEDVVVTPLLLAGQAKHVVFRRITPMRQLAPMAPGEMPYVEVETPFYELMGQGPLSYDAERLADTVVFSKQDVARTQTIAATLEFVLHLVPVGAVADHLVFGTGTRQDAIISALGDLTLGLGAIAKITVNTRRVLMIARASGAIEGGIAVYGYGQCVVLGAKGDVLSAAGKAGEATMRLLGATALLTTKLDRGAWKEVDVVRGVLLERKRKNTPKNFPYFDEWDTSEAPKIAVSQKSKDLFRDRNLKSMERSLRSEVRKIMYLPPRIEKRGYIEHGKTKIVLKEIKGRVLRVVVEPGEIRRRHRKMFERLREYGKELGLYDLWITEDR